MQTDIQTIAKAAGVTPAYVRMIQSGERRPSLLVALRIYDATKLQFGPLEGLNKRDIDAARRIAA